MLSSRTSGDRGDRQESRKEGKYTKIDSDFSRSFFVGSQRSRSKNEKTRYEMAPWSSTELLQNLIFFSYNFSADDRAAENTDGWNKQEAPWLFAVSYVRMNLFSYCKNENSGRDEWTRRTRGTFAVCRVLT
jgi:hypothetical protein